MSQTVNAARGGGRMMGMDITNVRTDALISRCLPVEWDMLQKNDCDSGRFKIVRDL